MNIIYKNLLPNGLLIWGAPVGKDALVWNAHRVYGPERLPLLFRNFRITKWYGYSPKVLFNQPLDENGFQPVVTLRKVDESLFKDNIKVVL